MATLYTRLKDAGVPIDNHESDLYAKVTPESALIVPFSGHSYTTFVSQIDHERWYDVPLAYDPFWTARIGRAEP